MKLNHLTPAEGSVKNRKRIARGTGSGRGGTSTRGHKGAQSRSGYSRKRGFEGGQMPLQRRIPKFGFKNINRVEYKGINLDFIQKLIDARKGVEMIDSDFLRKAGVLTGSKKIKILGRGELNSKIEIKAHAFSESAKKAIEAKGGSAVVIGI